MTGDFFPFLFTYKMTLIQLRKKTKCRQPRLFFQINSFIFKTSSFIYLGSNLSKMYTPLLKVYSLFLMTQDKHQLWNRIFNR